MPTDVPPAKALRQMPPPPPPPGPRSSRPKAPPPPVPTAHPSTQQKVALTMSALSLRDEQVEAKIRFYNADQQTNAELDAITAQVVAELEAMKATEEPRASAAPDVEVELIHSLRALLEKLFSPQRTGFLNRKMQDVQRRITRLFFNSELYAELSRRSQVVGEATWPEQALYFVLKRHEKEILEQLAKLPVADDGIRKQATDRFNGFTKKLCTDFLVKATPELEALLGIYSDELTRFFYKEFPESLGEFCWEVIRESRVAVGHRLGYKITEDKFRAFRSTFDKKLLERLIFHVQEPINQRATESEQEFREATMRFVNDPRIHSEICSAINDAVYDYLHGEGYLDLPEGWQRALSREGRDDNR